jgi:RNA polymerase sigma-70 factor, ECF subfamily
MASRNTNESIGKRSSAPPGPAFSFAQVYDENFRYVWRCLRSLGVPTAQLDDAVQEVFMVVQQKLETFDGAAPVRSWLYAIALRVARRVRRATALDARRFLRPRDDEESGDPCHETRIELSSDLRVDVEKSERLALARRALDTLDETKREVFVLACIEGMSAPELVGILGIPLNTVYSRLRAARMAFLAAARDIDATDSGEHPTRDLGERLVPHGTR